MLDDVGAPDEVCPVRYPVFGDVEGQFAALGGVVAVVEHEEGAEEAVRVHPATGVRELDVVDELQARAEHKLLTTHKQKNQKKKQKVRFQASISAQAATLNRSGLLVMLPPPTCP